ncbi:MAG: hypothetical protein HYT85_08640 [candidate division NC10 bacterium]|nr:hypothetical protein [candidate division NC10 bacterium]MBI2115134.1 hypothetical protein [candidate division NC10 bacterium]MBI2561785.1 hypothetical protein [candidate division NC10 bacterium]
MAQPRQGQPARRRRRPARRWTLGATAPDWFRRVWEDRLREVPKPDDLGARRKKVSNLDPAHIRRIAYL